MPRLLLFAPCQQALIDQNSNVSLVGILSSLQATIDESQVPEGAALPLRWDFFVLWAQTADDEGKEYEQLCELVGPDKKFPLPSTTFPMDKRFRRVVTTVIGFPLLGNGEYVLRLLLREKAEGVEPREVATFPIVVKIAAERQ